MARRDIIIYSEPVLHHRISMDDPAQSMDEFSFYSDPTNGALNAKLPQGGGQQLFSESMQKGCITLFVRFFSFFCGRLIQM